MKQLAVIVFSLLLIVGQTFAVVAPVSSKPTMAKPSCCGEKCDCSLGQAKAPASLPIESNAPSVALQQLILPPSLALAFVLAAPDSEVSSSCGSVDISAAAPPLFRRNCTMLL